MRALIIAASIPLSGGLLAALVSGYYLYTSPLPLLINDCITGYSRIPSVLTCSYIRHSDRVENAVGNNDLVISDLVYLAKSKGINNSQQRAERLRYLIRLFKKYGSDINASELDKEPALFRAVFDNSPSLVCVLLDEGADPANRYQKKTHEGFREITIDEYMAFLEKKFNSESFENVSKALKNKGDYCAKIGSG